MSCVGETPLLDYAFLCCTRRPPLLQYSAEVGVLNEIRAGCEKQIGLAAKAIWSANIFQGVRIQLCAAGNKVLVSEPRSPIDIFISFR